MNIGVGMRITHYDDAMMMMMIEDSCSGQCDVLCYLVLWWLNQRRKAGGIESERENESGSER